MKNGKTRRKGLPVVELNGGAGAPHAYEFVRFEEREGVPVNGYTSIKRAQAAQGAGTHGDLRRFSAHAEELPNGLRGLVLVFPRTAGDAPASGRFVRVLAFVQDRWQEVRRPLRAGFGAQDRWVRLLPRQQ